jgi:hypothetical protein
MFPVSEPFDFIHVRSMGGSIADWPRLLRQAYDNLAPGGWIELNDGTWATSDDNSFPDDSSYAEFQRRLHEAFMLFGKRVNIGPCHKQGLIEANFEDVVEVIRKVRTVMYFYLFLYIRRSAGRKCLFYPA